MIFWIIHSLIFAIWFAIVSFIWNNKWRGRADHAELYSDPILSLLMHLVWIAFPIASSFMMLFRYRSIFALITLALYIALTFAISEWRYLVIFSEYKRLYKWDLEQNGTLRHKTETEIDSHIKELLKANVRRG